MENNIERSTESPYDYAGSPSSLAVIVMSVIIPGFVLLACFITSIFLCWYRDRIPIFRSKAQKFSSPGAKTQVPLGSGAAAGSSSGGYPTQNVPLEKSSAAAEEGSMFAGDEEKKSVPADEADMIMAVDVYETSNL